MRNGVSSRHSGKPEGLIRNLDSRFRGNDINAAPWAGPLLRSYKRWRIEPRVIEDVIDCETVLWSTLDFIVIEKEVPLSEQILFSLYPGSVCHIGGGPTGPLQ